MVTENNTVIIGSYRKFYDKITNKIDYFERQGIRVLAPIKSKIINPGADFVIFEADQGLSISEIENEFLNSIKKADFVYIFNPNGYVGISSAYEMGFAYALNKTIICMEKPQDKMLQYMCTKIEQ